jgi:PAS domain S-box-containing protein
MDERLYRMVVEQTRDYAVFILDPTGHILTWNLGAQRIKGYRHEEIIGRHFSTFYLPAAIESGWPAHELKMATSEGRFEDEGWRLRKDGTRFWAAVTITALRTEDGRLLGFSKITRDLTERKMNEEALRQSEERFRLLIDGVVDYAVFMLDPEGVITSWNTGATRIMGYAREEIIGRHISRFFVPEDLGAGRPWEEIAIARKEGRAENEGWRVRKSGERFWARAVVTALYDPEGRPRGFAKVTQDLSERRYIEDLKTAAKNVNEFIAMLAHELRNPLAPIRTAVQVMAHTQPDTTAYRKLEATIDRQSAQLVRVVDDMIDVSRISRGALSIDRERFDLADAVARSVEAAMPLVNAGKHRLTVESPAGSLFVEGDIDRMAQILTNLLTNAARYSEDGGSIVISAASVGDEAVVRVRDTGHGIDPGDMAVVFHMFVQGRAPTSAVRGGMGIALSRRLAELHGGTLEGHSAGLGKGSEFVLRVPLTPAGDGQPAKDTPFAMTGRRRRRILVVDDNVDAAQTLELLLRTLGHDTRIAYDGANALQSAEDFHPDVVLLDIGMPGIDGYEVARRLRAICSPPPQIIAITGWGQEADRERSREAGFDVHLVKPIDPRELLQAMDAEPAPLR